MNTKHIIADCLNDMGKYNELLEIYYHVENIQTDILGINQRNVTFTMEMLCSFKLCFLR